MAKTRSQSLTSSSKNEASETTQPIRRTNTTACNKIAKRGRLPKAVNPENPKPKELISPTIKIRKRWATDEKIKKLIHYVEHDKMTLKDAGEKANLGETATYKYYGLYRDDPEYKIPTVGRNIKRAKGYFTYEAIEAMIHSLVHDKLTIEEAAKKANMHKKTVVNYYSKYMKDPEHKIPMQGKRNTTVNREYTQEDVKRVIGYIERDHMSITEAAKKADVNRNRAGIYYDQYTKDLEKKIPTPHSRRHEPKKNFATHEQLKEMIHYITNEKMALKDAAIKAGIPHMTASKYYVKYLQDPDHEIPVPGKPRYPLGKRCTDEQVKQIIDCINEGKMTMTQIAKKVGVAPGTCSLYYQKYLNDPDRKIPSPRRPTRKPKKCCTYEQVKNLIGYIVNDKMSILKAGLKAGIGRTTASLYYKKYLDEGKIPVPEDPKESIPSPDKVRQFLGYVLDDDLSIIEAARKTDIRRATAYIYHNIYVQDPLRGDTKPDVDEQLKQLVGYIEDDNMVLAHAAKKVGINYTAAAKLYNNYKKNPDKRVITRHDLFNDNLRVITQMYKERHNIKQE